MTLFKTVYGYDVLLNVRHMISVQKLGFKDGSVVRMTDGSVHHLAASVSEVNDALNKAWIARSEVQASVRAMRSNG